MTGSRLKPLAHGLGALYPDDVGARDHDLAGDGVAQLEHRVDHVALAGLHDAALLGHVDQLTQLDLGGERAVAEAAAGSEHVADQDQQRRHRAEHSTEQLDDAGGGERDPVGVLPAERPRSDPDEDVADHDHHAGGGEDRLPATAPHVVEEDGDQDRREGLADDPQQEQEGHVAGPLEHDLLEGGRAFHALTAHLLDSRLGDPLQSRVHGGEEAGERNQADGDHEQGDRSGTHRGPDSRPAGSPVTGSRGAERQPSMSFC
jgi:hypothetical protein